MNGRRGLSQISKPPLLNLKISTIFLCNTPNSLLNFIFSVKPINYSSNFLKINSLLLISVLLNSHYWSINSFTHLPSIALSLPNRQKSFCFCQRFTSSNGYCFWDSLLCSYITSYFSLFRTEFGY